MRALVDPLGKHLVRAGALSEEALRDVLEQQRHTLPVASLCYVLGYAGEEPLVSSLSRQCGVPGVVLDRCIVELAVLDRLPREMAFRCRVLPLLEDERRIFVAAERPGVVTQLLRELEFVSGKAVVVHVAVFITLARTLRACYRARALGELFYFGPDAAAQAPPEHGVMVVVSDKETIPEETPLARARDALVEDVTKELLESELILIDSEQSSFDGGGSTVEDITRSSPGGRGTGAAAAARGATAAPAGVPSVEEKTATNAGTTATSGISEVGLFAAQNRQVIDLDEGAGVEVTRPRAAGPHRVLVVDDDLATRQLLVKELRPLGLQCSTAATGGEAIRMIRGGAIRLVIIDVMLPEIDGFQVCRAIRQSRRYSHIPVILMSAVIDSGRVTDEVLRRYGADAYFEKPLNTERIRRRISDLLRAQGGRAPTADDDSFERAMDLYRLGKVPQAVEALRDGLRVDPLSAKHHFVLANLLQKQSLLYEAIDEYEATVDLKPDYFPALTRLAYLYYKKGFSAKAIEAWRRSLPHCPDNNLRRNIEIFMRKLIADMQSEA